MKQVTSIVEKPKKLLDEQTHYWLTSYDVKCSIGEHVEVLVFLQIWLQTNRNIKSLMQDLTSEKRRRKHV